VLKPGAEVNQGVALKPLKKEIEKPALGALTSQPPLEKGGPPPPPPPPPSPFYRQWWFWTAVGVVVAGAAGVSVYMLLSGGPAGQGNVAATWK